VYWRSPSLLNWDEILGISELSGQRTIEETAGWVNCRRAIGGAGLWVRIKWPRVRRGRSGSLFAGRGSQRGGRRRVWSYIARSQGLERLVRPLWRPKGLRKTGDQG
jgi:hypothetical protein